MTRGKISRKKEKDFVKIATRYAKDVLEGKVPACEFVKQACERQLKDLKRKRFRYKFDKDRAAHICKFVELLPHIKGKWKGKPIELEPWQVFILSTVFGWVDKKGLRRFKAAYIEVPRKNAKSTLSSGVGLYMLTADREGGPEVYSAATTKDQAKIVWSDAKAMVELCPGIRKKFGVSTSLHSIYTKDYGKFLAMARDTKGNHDGQNVHCGIIDELHAHKTRDIYDVVETATGARAQPLIWAITTAGFNKAGICYEQRDYVKKILNGVIPDEEYFGIIYTIDDTDDWADPKSQAKANPNWGISVNPEDIARKALKAVNTPSAQNNFLTKHLNVWVNAGTSWLSMKDWEACGDASLRLEDFKGERAWIAIDLASKVDLAAVVIWVQRDGVLYMFRKFYLPEAIVEESDNSHYDGWAKQGYITLTDGNRIDQNVIQEDIRQLAKDLEVMSVGYDPWQATKFAMELTEEGLPMYEYRQTVQNMSEPMKELEALIKSREMRHEACPVMTWMMSNVVAHLDNKDNIYPRKEFPQNKIDGPVAAIMALGEFLTVEDTTSVYEEHGIREL